MKKLSEVTKEDAIAILSVAYGTFFLYGKWNLTDESEDLKEPCKKLHSKTKAYQFWFFDNCIDLEEVPTPDREIELFDDANWDVKYRCYLKAAESGYYVPGMTELLRRIISDLHPSQY